MTNKNLSVVIATLILFSTSALYAADPYPKNAYMYKSSTPSGKKGYADLAKISDSYKLTKDFEKAFKAKVNEKDAERKVFVDEIIQIRKEAPKLSESVRAEKQVIVDQKIMDLKEFDRKTRDWLIAARNAMLGNIQKNIDSETALIANAEGYESIIISKVAKEGKDITSQVIQGLNEKYDRDKAGGGTGNITLKSSPVKEEAPDVSKNKEDDTVTQLERLASLKEKGILTEEEFQSQKKKILSR